jgi:dephospho-CoA kinase
MGVENRIVRLPKTEAFAYKIGITGTIASGKSLVGNFLTAEGVPTLDTDSVVADLYETDARLKAQLVQAFGEAIKDANGGIDKKALGEIVFRDIAKRKALEALVHPRVVEKVTEFLKDQALPRIRAVLAPLLFEAKTESRYDEVWVVKVDLPILRQRLMKRENLSMEDAERRISAQWSQAEKEALADRVIDNSGSMEATKVQVLEALAKIQEKQTVCDY